MSRYVSDGLLGKAYAAFSIVIPAYAGMTAVRLFGFIAILYQMSSETVDSDVRPT
ncbi:hypothetical protein [Neisseria sicca]|uniref:hypothetical protein n=1 Tax=Neisseria sicca TaxID=490 RepID=UPI00195C5E0E|nr:hypothetical protein [Neisseria sicca]